MSAETCPTCSGVGHVTMATRGAMFALVTCSGCAGIGQRITPRDPEHDARMLDDLRAWRSGIDGGRRASLRIMAVELDMLLAIVDERDALKAERDNVTRPMSPVEISTEPDVEEREECQHVATCTLGGARYCLDCNSWLDV